MPEIIGMFFGTAIAYKTYIQTKKCNFEREEVIK